MMFVSCFYLQRTIALIDKNVDDTNEVLQNATDLIELSKGLLGSAEKDFNVSS